VCSFCAQKYASILLLMNAIRIDKTIDRDIRCEIAQEQPIEENFKV